MPPDSVGGMMVQSVGPHFNFDGGGGGCSMFKVLEEEKKRGRK